jgi:hypothetical protein
MTQAQGGGWYVQAVGLAAEDNCFQKQVLFGFDHRHQVDVAMEPYHEDALPWVALLVGVLLHVEQIACFNRNHHRLEAQLPLGEELSIVLKAPREGLHQASLGILCA